MSNRAQLWGRRFGELTAIKAVGSDQRGVRWLCRCDCGERVMRYAGRLLLAKRSGHVSCCSDCLRELQRGRYAYHVGPAHRRYWRELWEDRGTLYSTGQEIALTASVRRAVAREMGFAPRDESAAPDRARTAWEPVARNGPAMTLEEIGQELSRSRERVRQIEARALQKLRRLLTAGPPRESVGQEQPPERPPPPKLSSAEIAEAKKRHRQWLAEKARRERARAEWSTLF
jgi:hypothetical protein